MKNTTKKTSRKTTSASTRKTTSKKTVERNRIDAKLFIVPTVDGNPRRKGSFGHKSFSIIAGARKPVQVEQFVNKGGRLRDLHWDITKGNAKLVRKAS